MTQAELVADLVRRGRAASERLGELRTDVKDAALLLPAVHALIQLPLAARMPLTAALVLALGVPLGMPLVAGIRLLDPTRPEQVAWAWAVNGASAVVGSCLLMIAMVYSGSTLALLIAGGSYAVALLARSRLAAAQVGGLRPGGRNAAKIGRR